MKLTELSPIWISLGGNARKSGFIFKCPHCRDIWLMCKSIPAHLNEQTSVMTGRGEWVPVKREAIWHWEGDFADLNVNPSINASASGHWHGFIKNGEIVGA